MATVTNINDVQVGDTLTSAQIYEAATGSKPGIEENKSRKDLEYPLNNPDEYKGRLVFNVMKEPETDLGNISEAASSFAKSIGDGLKNALQTENPEEVAKAVKSHKGEVNVPIIKQRPLIKLDRQVSLYLPVGLQYRDNVAYENMDLGGMGGAAERGLQSGSGAIKSLIEGGMKTLSAGLGGAANKEVAKLGVVKLASNLPDEVAGAFKSAAGVTTNPNTRVLFKQVNLREFAFAFKFHCNFGKRSRRSKRDYQIIQNRTISRKY